MSTPGASSSQPPSRSLDRQVVLDEDEYTEALSHIIARDFFPSLVHLDATNNYLDALQTQDPLLIQASVRRLEDLQTPVSRRGRPWQTPSQTPYAAGPMDTPLRASRTERGEGEGPSKRPRLDIDLSLDVFQARYTSEDNSSFTQILENENKRRKEKYGWAWEAQRRVEAQRDRMLEGRERLLIEAPSGTGVKEKFRIEAPMPAGLIEAGPAEAPAVYEDDEDEVEDLIDGTYVAPLAPEQNKDMSTALVKVEKRKDPDGDAVDVMVPKKDTRPAGVDGWKFKARNALMFPPDADVAPYNSSSANAAEGSKGPPKVIKHGNTRFPGQDDRADHSLSAPPSPTRSRIDAAIAGTPYRPRSPTNDVHSLVPSIPSPTPSELGPAAVKQLMTWGTLNATPRVLSQSDDPADIPTPSTPFRIMEPSSRERLSHKLSSDAAKSLRAKATLLSGVPLLSRSMGGGGSSRRTSMPPPSFTPRRADAPGSLTPAAKRLLDRSTMGTAASRRADAMGRLAGWEGERNTRDLQKVRWTPTPSPVTRRG
ncbi:nuclear protein DGCR14 [Ganoderma leucocontextum]|nr:nuclear protein DGCR14 [Ganoderma leucocontextum]